MTRTLLGILSCGLCAVVVLACQRPVRQPIAFNHSVHVTGEQMECTECHAHAKDGAQATLPGLDVCEGCHSEAQGKSAEEAKVVAAVNAKEPIAWQRVYWVPDHVFFPHRRHVKVAKITCPTCHGEVPERTRPFTVSDPPVSMGRCVDCHQTMHTTDDCAACHR